MYLDGLQRDQFIPFIKTIKNFCIEYELVIKKDYRKSGFKTSTRFFYPLNDSTRFNINQLFREITKGKKMTTPTVDVKGRSFFLNQYYEGVLGLILRVCSENVGAEDYIAIAEKSKFIVLDNVPNFNNENVNDQQRFITLIDIFMIKNSYSYFL